MAESPENKYCLGCGTDITNKGIEHCPKCQTRINLGRRLALLKNPENTELYLGLKNYLALIAQNSLKAMANAIATGDNHNAAIECGVWQNSESLLDMIEDELKWVLKMSKPKEKES